MSRGEVSFHRLGYYLAHVVHSDSQRRIAQRHGVDDSTVLRGINAVEDARALPTWDAVIGALERWAEGVKPGELVVDFDTTARALGSTRTRVAAALTEAAATLALDGVVLRIGPHGPAGIVAGMLVVVPVARAIALAWLAWGALREVGRHGPAVDFGLTHAAMKLAGARPDRLAPALRRPISAVRRPSPNLGAASLMRSLGPELYDMALGWRVIWQMRDAGGSGPVRRAAERLHPTLYAALAEVIGDGGGLEAFEGRHNLPARSGKVVVRLALETVARAGDLTPPRHGRR
jgi:hypothetical protein